MIKYLTRHGNSLALLIEKPILDLLKISPDSPLEISTDGQKLVIALAPPGVHSENQRRHKTETDNEKKRR